MLAPAGRGDGRGEQGLHSPDPRANVAPMLKRLFAVFSLFVLAVPSLAAAQGVVVHGRQVIVHKRIAVHAFEGGRRGKRGSGRHTEKAGTLQD